MILDDSKDPYRQAARDRELVTAAQAATQQRLSEAYARHTQALLNEQARREQLRKFTQEFFPLHLPAG